MKMGELRSIGHNLADSLASGMGFLIGVYQMDVFAEAAGEPEGFVVVDFLAGKTTASTVSASFRKAIALYKDDALPEICKKHGIDAREFKTLEARFGTDAVYGPHFTVTVEGGDGKRSVDRYIGVPGKRLRQRR